MAKVNNIQTNLQNVADIATLRRFVSAAIDGILAQFNGKVDFGDNIRTDGPHTITFSSTTQPVLLPHGLGRLPIGFWTTQINGPNIVYVPDMGSFPWTSTQVYLQCNGLVTAQVMLF